MPSSRPRTVAIHTHGCKLNQADSASLARQFAAAGYAVVDSPRDADVFVLNTCTVTANADAKARQALRAARRANPQALIVATGCYPQRSRDELSRVEAVSLVVDNAEKSQLVPLVTGRLDGSGSGSQAPRQETLGGVAPVPRGRSRAMMKIQEGCNQVCAYCIVPKVRGRERSIPPEVLVRQVSERVSEGYLEVTLTGTQLGSYGFDIPGAGLTGLLRAILEDTDVPRLRVSSLQPQEIGPELLELWQDRRLCPHFHVPLQSGSDQILRAMRPSLRYCPLFRDRCGYPTRPSRRRYYGGCDSRLPRGDGAGLPRQLRLRPVGGVQRPARFPLLGPPRHQRRPPARRCAARREEAAGSRNDVPGRRGIPWLPPPPAGPGASGTMGVEAGKTAASGSGTA